MHEATEANATTCEEKANYVERGMVISIPEKAARMLGGALSSIQFGVLFTNIVNAGKSTLGLPTPMRQDYLQRGGGLCEVQVTSWDARS